MITKDVAFLVIAIYISLESFKRKLSDLSSRQAAEAAQDMMLTYFRRQLWERSRLG